MNKYKLDIFADGDEESRTSELRNSIADYARFKGETEWRSLGVGFTQLDESPNAQTDSETFINEVDASASVTRYETEFAYTNRLIAKNAAVRKLYYMGRNRATGEDAELDYIRADLFLPVKGGEENEYLARQFRVINSVTGITGGGGEKISISGSFKQVGDLKQGKFNTVTKEFTEGEFVSIYDEAVEAAG